MTTKNKYAKLSIMKKIVILVCFIACFVIVHAQNNSDNRTSLFDAGWRFIKDSTISGDIPGYNDSKWRTVDLPHDWSIEDLPNQTPDTISRSIQQKQYWKSSYRIYSRRNWLVPEKIYNRKRSCKTNWSPFILMVCT